MAGQILQRNTYVWAGAWVLIERRRLVLEEQGGKVVLHVPAHIGSQVVDQEVGADALGQAVADGGYLQVRTLDHPEVALDPSQLLAGATTQVASISSAGSEVRMA